MSQMNTNSVGAIAGAIDLGATGSLQLRFAKLQLALSEISKQSAMKEIDSIEKAQEEQKKVADMLQEARKLQTEASSKDAKSDKKVTFMPDEMKAYMDQHKLAYDKTSPNKDKDGNFIDDQLHFKEEWEVAITSLKAHLDQINTNTQQKMVFVQDFMGQYNSYLQGANSAIQQSNQTLADLARLR